MMLLLKADKVSSDLNGYQNHDRSLTLIKMPKPNNTRDSGCEPQSPAFMFPITT